MRLSQRAAPLSSRPQWLEESAFSSAAITLCHSKKHTDTQHSHTHTRSHTHTITIPLTHPNLYWLVICWHYSRKAGLSKTSVEKSSWMIALQFCSVSARETSPIVKLNCWYILSLGKCCWYVFFFRFCFFVHHRPYAVWNNGFMYWFVLSLFPSVCISAKLFSAANELE